MAPRGARVLLDEKPAPLPSGRKDASRRLSTSKAKRALRNGHQDWLIVFTDVVVRAEKVGETECVFPLAISTERCVLTLRSSYSIPGSFSRGNEKKGRQGKLRKTGKLRNTCKEPPASLTPDRPLTRFAQIASSVLSGGKRRTPLKKRLRHTMSDADSRAQRQTLRTATRSRSWMRRAK